MGVLEFPEKLFPMRASAFLLRGRTVHTVRSDVIRKILYINASLQYDTSVSRSTMRSVVADCVTSDRSVKRRPLQTRHYDRTYIRRGEKIY